MTKLGIQIGASTSPADLGDVVRRAEEYGYGEIWLAEDYFQLGGIASAAIALAATNTIPVGLGVVAAVVRHPAVTAMEFATLAGSYSGRFMAGLGHGSPGWVRQMGLTPDEMEDAGIGPGTIRISVGLEHTADLVDDVEQALAAASSSGDTTA